MHRHKLERVLVVNDAFELRGLMTVKDITKQTNFPNAARDSLGKLRVGAAVGVGEGTEERVERWSRPASTPSSSTPRTATAPA
jgi:IMP dehydrogenase